MVLRSLPGGNFQNHSRPEKKKVTENQFLSSLYNYFVLILTKKNFEKTLVDVNNFRMFKLNLLNRYRYQLVMKNQNYMVPK